MIITMWDILRSLVIEANPTISHDRAEELVGKYITTVWTEAAGEDHVIS